MRPLSLLLARSDSRREFLSSSAPRQRPAHQFGRGYFRFQQQVHVGRWQSPRHGGVSGRFLGGREERFWRSDRVGFCRYRVCQCVRKEQAVHLWDTRATCGCSAHPPRVSSLRKTLAWYGDATMTPNHPKDGKDRSAPGRGSAEQGESQTGRTGRFSQRELHPVGLCSLRLLLSNQLRSSGSDLHCSAGGRVIDLRPTRSHETICLIGAP